MGRTGWDFLKKVYTYLSLWFGRHISMERSYYDKGRYDLGDCTGTKYKSSY